jgi:YHS domain-containing protein
VTEAIKAAGQTVEVEFQPVGAHALKGVSDPVELFEVRGTDEHAPKATDPVCGMELDDASAEAHLTWQGKALWFCSEGCLRRFLDRPDAYAHGDHS